MLDDAWAMPSEDWRRPTAGVRARTDPCPGPRRKSTRRFRRFGRRGMSGRKQGWRGPRRAVFGRGGLSPCSAGVFQVLGGRRGGIVFDAGGRRAVPGIGGSVGPGRRRRGPAANGPVSWKRASEHCGGGAVKVPSLAERTAGRAVVAVGRGGKMPARSGDEADERRTGRRDVDAAVVMRTSPKRRWCRTVGSPLVSVSSSHCWVAGLYQSFQP